MTRGLAISRFAPLLILALVWEGATRAQLVASSVLPPLSDVITSLIRMLSDDLAQQLAASLLRGMIGLGLATAFGTAIGVLMAWYRPFRQIVKPFIELLYPLPKSALIPIAIVWLGLGNVSKVSLIFVGTMLPVIVSAFNATRGVDQMLVWSARSVGAREPSILLEIVLPAAAPEILNGIRVALALSFILVVAGELIFANNGIGYVISMLGESGDESGMFAGILAISLAGFAADRLFVFATRSMTAWREQA